MIRRVMRAGMSIPYDQLAAAADQRRALQLLAHAVRVRGASLHAAVTHDFVIVCRS